ncbi:Gfo/Idh/MocA family protein [Tropicimonas sp.]|uniref:Gfo/Idh/MocA family protein n=1 Tax=Tropicimonas sp. TaxID=2067044 RepID=UPI003A85F34E
MTNLGVGIIGCGNISTAYLTLAPLFRGLEMRAVADINAEAVAARAGEFGVRAYTVDELLDADDIDVIVNLTIPDAHFSVSAAILEAGKHVYSEKPFVLSLDKGEALHKLAAGRGLRVGSAPDTFLGGSHQQARALIDGDAIGRITSGTAHVMSRGMEAWHPNPGFFFQPGGGPVLDLGPYYITNLVQLLGPVRRVAALSSAAFHTRTIGTGPLAGQAVPVNTPTTIHALLEFVSGASITFSSSWDVSAHRHAPMELYGTGGSLFVPDPNFFGGALEMAGGDRVIRPVEAWQHPFGIPNEEKDGVWRANYRVAGLADMAAAIAQGRPHRCSLELALHVIDVMTSILKSGEAGAFVDLSTTCDRPEVLLPEEAASLLRAAP